MTTDSALHELIDRAGIGRARAAAEASNYADALRPVIEAVAAEPTRFWRPQDGVELSKVVSAFNLDRILTKTVGYDFAELVDRARIHRALVRIAEPDSDVEAIAEEYWPPRTRAQQLKELQANTVVVDNKLSSRENLDAAFQKRLGRDLETVVRQLQG